MTDAVDEKLKRRQVGVAKAEATSGLPATPPASVQLPLVGRRIFFDGENLATDSFVRLEIADLAKRPPVIAAMKRLAGTQAGLDLLNSLSTSFFDKKSGRYYVFVVVSLSPDTQQGIEIEAGHVELPASQGAPYRVWIKDYKYDGPALVWPGEDTQGRVASLRGLTDWPPITAGANPWCVLTIYYPDDPAAMMAEALFHELLHVWFLEDARRRMLGNAPQRTYPTGHADQMKCEMDEYFHQLIKALVDELNAPILKRQPTGPGRFLD